MYKRDERLRHLYIMLMSYIVEELGSYTLDTRSCFHRTMATSIIQTYGGIG
jgi:hypothetical protein